MSALVVKHDVSPLPLDYASYGEKYFLHCITGPSTKPNDAFITQTERRMVTSEATRQLVFVDEIKNREREPIAGLIFHSARCGSTLLCNMLDSLPNCYVVRESGVLNKLLHDRTLSTAQRQGLLSAALICYSRYASSIGARCVIKFTSHCALRMPDIRALLPDTPWVYLHREPEEVVQSQLKKRAGWVSSTFVRQVLDVPKEQVPQQTAQQVALMLKHCYQEVIQRKSEQPNGRLLSYERLVASGGTVASEVARYFGFIPSEGEVSNMALCLSVDAKTGSQRKPESHRYASQQKLEVEQACQRCRKEYESLCDG